MWLQAPNISCTHGFSTRHGGLSQQPFNSLNLGGSEDDQNIIRKNRELALKQLDLDHSNLCFLKQVHSTKVCIAAPGAQEGDALVTNQKNRTLAISIADCYPILFYDKIASVIGAAHAGWRGTVGGIAGNTIMQMQAYGAKPENIQVAIGQGICQHNFSVGSEVIEQFEKSGFPDSCWIDNKIDLIRCNLFILQKNKIPESNIWVMNRCTFESDFFSYRRDKGKTGRMWGLISMT